MKFRLWKSWWRRGSSARVLQLESFWGRTATVSLVLEHSCKGLVAHEENVKGGWHVLAGVEVECEDKGSTVVFTWCVRRPRKSRPGATWIEPASGLSHTHTDNLSDTSAQDIDVYHLITTSTPLSLQQCRWSVSDSVMTAACSCSSSTRSGYYRRHFVG